MQHLMAFALGSAVVVSLVSLAGIFTLPFREDRLQRMTFVLISLATGALFGDAVIHLFPQIFRTALHPLRSSLWVLGGIFASFVFEKFLRWHHEHGMPHQHAIKPVGRIILVSDSLHNFIDGLLIGASYLAGVPVGMATTLAVILHELPHEIGDFGVLIHSGYSWDRALLFNFISACVSILGVLLAFAFQVQTPKFSGAAIALTAGSFLYIAGSDLTPELHKENAPLKSLIQILAMAAGVSLMLLLLLLD